ncbi:MAG: hypothetical protein HY746_03280 [Elusimicrobia bacterium]|nr:hypothetical protein [Elusimicrobiota bacterium]
MKSKTALISLLLGILSFIHLFGIEKAAMAIIFGTIALKEGLEDKKSGYMAKSGILLGLLYLVVLTVVSIKYFPEMFKLIENLK